MVGTVNSRAYPNGTLNDSTSETPGLQLGSMIRRSRSMPSVRSRTYSGREESGETGAGFESEENTVDTGMIR